MFIPVSKFFISKKLFALNPTSFVSTDHPNNHPNVRFVNRVEAVWFRRKDGVIAAHLGSFSSFSKTVLSFEEFKNTIGPMEARYGPTVKAKWDGQNLWGVTDFVEQNRIVAYLDPILQNYPEVPKGLEGWVTLNEDTVA
jgi:hypothetical protein